MPETPLALELIDIRKRYAAGDAAVPALDGVSIAVRPGELVGLMGPSGCGKSTLLNLAGLIDRPTEGTIRLGGAEATRLDDRALTRLRRAQVGYVFQFFNLLPTLTLLANAALPLVLLGRSNAEAHAEAERLFATLGLSAVARRFPHQVSGGQMQRAAIVRALIHRPALVLADEPTGNLDSASGAAVLELLASLARERGQAVLMATHSPEAAAVCDRVIRMRDGHVIADGT